MAIKQLRAKPRAMIEFRHRAHSSLSMEYHRWPMETAESRIVKVITSAEVNSKTCFYRGAPVSDLPEQPKYSDSFVELIGWFCTEGNVSTSHGKPSNYIKIHQSSSANPEKCDRIRVALAATFGAPVDLFPRTGKTKPTVPRWREMAPTSRPQERVFVLNTVAGAMLQEAAPNRVMWPEFVTSLTAAQLDLLWKTWIAGDGSSPTLIAQKSRARLEPLQMVLALSGVGSSLLQGPAGWHLRAFVSNRFGILKQDKSRVIHDGIVWSAITESSFWLARRYGRTFITGS